MFSAVGLGDDSCRVTAVVAMAMGGIRLRGRSTAWAAERMAGGGGQRWRDRRAAIALFMLILSPPNGSGSSPNTLHCLPMMPRVSVVLEGNRGGGVSVCGAGMLSVGQAPTSPTNFLAAKGESGGVMFEGDAQEMMVSTGVDLGMGSNPEVHVVTPLLPPQVKDTEMHPPPATHLSPRHYQAQDAQAARSLRRRRPGDDEWPCALCGSIGVSWGVAAQRQDGQVGLDERPPWGRLLCSRCARSERRRGATGVITLNRKCLLCTRSSTFGPAGGSRRDAVHCKVHRTMHEFDLVSIKCRSAGCLKHCMYGDPVEGPVPRYCAEHREGHHIDLKSKRCHMEGCNQRATHGYLPAEGEGVGMGRLALFCADHKEDTHVDVKRPTCVATCRDGARCARKPIFGDVGDHAVRYCAEHRREGQVDISNKRCEYPEGCTRRPLYPLESNRTEIGQIQPADHPHTAVGFPRAYCGEHWRRVMTPPAPALIVGGAGSGDALSVRGSGAARAKAGGRTKVSGRALWRDGPASRSGDGLVGSFSGPGKGPRPESQDAPRNRDRNGTRPESLHNEVTCDLARGQVEAVARSVSDPVSESSPVQGRRKAGRGKRRERRDGKAGRWARGDAVRGQPGRKLRLGRRLSRTVSRCGTGSAGAETKPDTTSHNPETLRPFLGLTGEEE